MGIEVVRAAIYEWFSDLDSEVNVSAMEERFWRFTEYPEREYLAIGEYPDRCILWNGTKQGDPPYGIFTIKAVRVYAHRVAYRLELGAIPVGWTIDHSREKGCKPNSLCVNPAHLECVTRNRNSARTRDLSVFT